VFINITLSSLSPNKYQEDISDVLGSNALERKHLFTSMTRINFKKIFLKKIRDH